jgi:hypothetical protein
MLVSRVGKKTCHFRPSLSLSTMVEATLGVEVLLGARGKGRSRDDQLVDCEEKLRRYRPGEGKKGDQLVSRGRGRRVGWVRPGDKLPLGDGDQLVGAASWAGCDRNRGTKSPLW